MVTVTPLWPNAVEIPKVVSGRVTCVSLEVQNGRWTLPLEKLLQALTPGDSDAGAQLAQQPHRLDHATGGATCRSSNIAVAHGIWILADDVYERLVYARE